MTAGSSEPVASTFNKRKKYVLKTIPGTKDFLADEFGNIYSPDGLKRNKKDSFRKINGWLFCYATSKNVEKIKTLISVPALV